MLPLGTEWLVDAHGCEPASLRSEGALAALFERAVRELQLHPLGEARFHNFPGAGGVTGFLMLTESHLACHTFPERGFAAFDLYCCRSREEWPWAERLREALGAREVSVRRLARGEP
jgi:S-adenosylmethionine decarboxylase